MKTREQRDSELQGWMHSDPAKIKQAWRDTHFGEVMPVTTVRYSQLIAQILEREYPANQWRRSAA